MSRRISTKFQAVVGGLGGSRSTRQDNAVPASSQEREDYLGRLLKYIPAELVGLYLAARGIIPSDQSDLDRILWIVAGVTWVLVPVYLYIATSRNGQAPLWWQIVLGTIAFPVWVFAIGGRPVSSLGWYAKHQFIGSLVLMFVTVIFGLKEP